MSVDRKQHHQFFCRYARYPRGRRIEGEFLLTAEDYSNRLRADDAVAQTGYPVDVHGYVNDDMGARPMGRANIWRFLTGV